ncbi:molybdenum cofactor biosynthesis protein B [Citromicrobium sp. JLT1363]|uniref:molybdenum cofactor biosynthesis protein B n=1 Tax=Citromicrobium sp. JLT1363 TaxID=517722 RepID=UPI000225DF83|nr:molybdenum cofactor biosynthesis protein B [Citromicrobium sp. JLT1363]
MGIDDSRSFTPIGIALITVSDTREPATDSSGDILEARVREAGHILIERTICPDDAGEIYDLLRRFIASRDVDCVITTGGTGLTGRDVTPEALDRVKDKDIPGFGELFRWISYENIGTSTIQSRACAVLAGDTFIFVLPGSNGAVKDGWDRILKDQLDIRHRPCNFVELMPRLLER